MVQEQLVKRDITDPNVIHAMREVPRHQFIPEENRSFAYEDGPVLIGHRQTISQPYIVALMTQSLELKKEEKVLEVGTGSGYQSAVLDFLGVKTYTIEIVPELAKFAEENLKRTGHPSVKIKTGDGYEGWKEFAPYDAIIVTCAPDKIPQPLIDQMSPDGRMIIPVGTEHEIQDLVLARKIKGQIERKSIAPVRFVPMVKENK